MDQLLRRTRMAERQVARRLKKLSETRFKLGLKVDRQNLRAKMVQEIAEQRREAVRARREDWELGPLAPRRDVPKRSDRENRHVGSVFLDEEKPPWGAISSTRAELEWMPSLAERDKVAAWAGGIRYLCLAVGDRVAIREGPLKGQIGVIAKIERNKAGLQLKDIGRINVAKASASCTPENPGRVFNVNSTLPISAVRLVHPMTRPGDDVTRDVVIRELRPQRIRNDRVTGRTVFERVVPGARVCIPWPAVPPKERADRPGDTLRLEVEERTFVPTLGQAPMPPSVLDELRNRYSRFRTRHDDDYVARLEAEQAERDAIRRSVEKMRTPLQEFHLREREARRARGQPVLTEEMLSKIGEVILGAGRGHGGGGGGSVKKDTTTVGHLQKAVEQLSLQSPKPEALAGQPKAS